MVDLNLWQLAYSDTVLEFGTHESGHPFTAQVDVGPVDLEADDLAHPLSDGLTMGRDFTRGRVLGFTGAHLDTFPLPTDRRWVPVLDGAQPFEGAWQAEWCRERPGRLATCANLDRGRLVYGRPRTYVQGLEEVRKGWLTYSAAFATVDGRFYSTDEKVLLVGTEPSSVAAFAFPVAFPFTGATPAAARSWAENAGTHNAWPIITFRRGGNPKVTMLGDDGWVLKVDRNLDDNDEVVVDCRPWKRTVTLNGTPRPGLVRGSRLDDVRIPTGWHELVMEAADPTGLAETEVRWRDAYGSL